MKYAGISVSALDHEQQEITYDAKTYVNCNGQSHSLMLQIHDLLLCPAEHEVHMNRRFGAE